MSQQFVYFSDPIMHLHTYSERFTLLYVNAIKMNIVSVVDIGFCASGLDALLNQMPQRPPRNTSKDNKSFNTH